MKYKVVALLPLVMAATLAAASIAMGDRMHVALGVGNEAGKLLSLAGALAAAFAFERGEYLNRAWLTYGACYLMLLVNDAMGAAHLTGEGWTLARALVVLVGNACSVGGAWMFAHASVEAGLDDDDDARRRRRTLFVVAAVLSLAINGWTLMADVRSLLGGRNLAMISIASDLGDTFTLALIAPVLQTALALRGGVLRWPWGLLTVSGIMWILYDVTSDVIVMRDVGPGLALVGSECLRMLANGWILSAGMAQRWAVAPTERLSMHPVD